jgi:type IV secretory pathway VirJ component
MKHVRLSILLLFIVHVGTAKRIQPDSLTIGKFGKVWIYKPASPKEVVLFISGDGGWRYGVIDMARALSDKGALVAGIDIRNYWKNAQQTPDACIYSSGDFETLSNFLQQKYNFRTYRKPILGGYSSGATLVYGLMAQAPLETYKGGIAMGFCPDIIGKKPLCEGSGLHHTVLPDGKGYDLLPRKDLTTPFAVLIGALDKICDSEHTAAFMKNIPGERIYRLAKVGHGFSNQKNWMPQFLKAYDDIVQHPEEKAPAAVNPGNLPVTVTPCENTSTDQPLLFGISGDGGWRGFIDNLGTDLTTHKIPVVGLDALHYFWSAKTPDQTTADVANAIRFYLKKWNKNSFVLLGYSFGANVMPFIVNRLPQDLRTKLRLVVLLSPDNRADFEFHFSSWLNKAHASTFMVLPEIQKMQGVHTMVFYGKDETHRPATALPNDVVQIVMVNGDHHYHYEHASMSAIIAKKAAEIYQQSSIN